MYIYGVGLWTKGKLTRQLFVHERNQIWCLKETWINDDYWRTTKGNPYVQVLKTKRSYVYWKKYRLCVIRKLVWECIQDSLQQS